jgi:signal transduction histidine kinase
MVMSTNITEIRRLQDHLTSLGMLLGSVSHGVKGLLTGLDGGIYRLESALRKDDKAKSQEALEVVKQTVGRIRRMVLNILYYAKSRELQVEELDLHSFVQDVVQPIKSKAQRSEIELICDFESSLGKMEADPHTLSSALVNFLENAIEACESREKQADRKVLFKVSGYEKYVFFEISDTGVGMDQETKDKLFTLFFSSKGAKGTGLGLYIAKQVIDQHGGHIEVQSDPGEGTSFEIFLPRIMPNAVKNPQCPQG